MDRLQEANLKRGYLVGPRSEDEMVREPQRFLCRASRLSFTGFVFVFWWLLLETEQCNRCRQSRTHVRTICRRSTVRLYPEHRLQCDYSLGLTLLHMASFWETFSPASNYPAAVPLRLSFDTPSWRRPIHFACFGRNLEQRDHNTMSRRAGAKRP